MLIEEFENYTGLHPDDALYREIESEYMSGPWEDKQSFCAAYKKNLDGMAARIQRKADAALGNQIIAYETKIRDLQNFAKDLQAKLDRELEWREYHDDHRMADKDYNRLAADVGCQTLSDDAAKQLLLDEIGFAPEKVSIVHELPAEEINKYHRIRTTGRTIRRAPLYSSTDWLYIAFTCCGYDYELVDGNLRRI